MGRGKGKSFACSRDSSPDRCYLPLQLKNVPGPGKVFLFGCSMKMELAQEQLMPANKNQQRQIIPIPMEITM